MKKIDMKIFKGHSISEKCFSVIEELLPPNKILLELGSGNATAVFTQLWEVYTVEHDPIWFNKASNAAYIKAPLVNNWYNVEILKKNLPKKYDMLLVDGPPGKDRLNLIKHLDLFKKNVIWVVDDVIRDANLVKSIEVYLGKEGKLYPSNGPGQSPFMVFR